MMKKVAGRNLRNIAAFTVAVLLAARAIWLWELAKTENGKDSLFYREDAKIYGFFSVCFLCLAPMLCSSRWMVVRLLAAVPFGLLVFAGVWLALRTLSNAVYGGWGEDMTPETHKPFWFCGKCLLAGAAAIFMINQNVKKGAASQLS